MNGRHRYSTWVLAFLFVAGVIVVYKTVDNFNFVFDYARKVIGTLGPFITGFVIAYLLNQPINRVQALLKKSRAGFVRKCAKGISITFVYILTVVLLMVFLRLIIPAIYQNVMDSYYSIPYYFNRVGEQLIALQEKLGLELITIDAKSAVAAVQKFLGNIQLSEFSKYALCVINATSGVISVFISVIISVYMLADKAAITSGIKRVLYAFISRDNVERFLEFASRTNDIFSKYIFSIVIDGIIVGVLSTVIMSLLKVKYAMVLGVMLGVFSLIPYFGAIVACVLAVIITLLTGGWLKALWTGIALFVLQQIDGNFIGPRIMGNMLEARPLLIIFAVTVGGGLFGIGGMVLSVPVVMVVKMIFEEILASREARNGQKDE